MEIKNRLATYMLISLSIAMLVTCAGVSANTLQIGSQISTFSELQVHRNSKSLYTTAKKQGELQIGDTLLTFFKTPSNNYLRVVFRDEKSSATLEVFSTKMMDGGFHIEHRIDGVLVLVIKSEFNTIGPISNQGKVAQVKSKALLSNKWWDGLYFSVPNGVRYYHPSKSYYNIKPWRTWVKDGNDLVHYMFDTATSELLLTIGLEAFLIAIATAIGGLIGNIPGAIVGAILGVIFAAYVGWHGATYWFDEDSNLWFWTSLALIEWYVANAGYLLFLYYGLGIGYAIVFATTGFLQNGYIQIGSILYADFIGKGPVGWY